MFEKQYDLRYFEMNKWGEASPLTMATLLQETASDHCNAIDYGLFDLYAQNIGWLLLSGYMHITRYPLFKEKITIRTWMSHYTSTRGYRENIIYDSSHNIIGRARGLWVFFDTKKKRPVRIFEKILQGWQPHSEVCIDYDIEDKLLHAEAITCQKNFNIYQYDLDANNHVNNLRFLQWALETVPDHYFDTKQLSTLDARFIREAYYGQTIASVTLADDENDCFHHRIQNATTGQLCAAVNTVWRERVVVAERKIYQFA